MTFKKWVERLTVPSDVSIKNTLISQGVKIAHATLEQYLNSLTDSLLFYAFLRFDVKGVVSYSV